MTVTTLVAVLHHIVLLIMIIFEMIIPIIILCITIPTTICFITYFFFKLIEKLVGLLIYYKTYNHNLSLENRINIFKKIIILFLLNNLFLIDISFFTILINIRIKFLYIIYNLKN